MGSYIIGVSVGTGCYRHIPISKTATLYQLHKAILEAFAFDDDHEHAFFLDNRLWSRDDAYFSSWPEPGERLTKKQSLQKLLREVEELTRCPRVLRSVGDAPEQFTCARGKASGAR